MADAESQSSIGEFGLQRKRVGGAEEPIPRRSLPPPTLLSLSFFHFLIL
jgi:hypothetical protein